MRLCGCSSRADRRPSPQLFLAGRRFAFVPILFLTVRDNLENIPATPHSGELQMRTIERAQTILAAAPGEALREAAGLAVLALLVFSGFLLPAMI